MSKKSAKKGTKRFSHHLKYPKLMHKKFFSPQKIVSPKKFSMKCFKKWGEKISRKYCQRNFKKSAQKSLVTFKSTHNKAQKSSFPQKKLSVQCFKKCSKKVQEKRAKWSALKSAQKSSSTLKSTKKGAQKSTFPPKSSQNSALISFPKKFP